MSKGTLFGASSHGASPSGTSRYFSVDIGLIHFVGLDLNAPETTPRTIGLDAGQLAWLAADLAAADANRAAVPWIVVTSHFPMYLSSAAAGEPAHGADSARWYLSDEAEAAVPGVDGTATSTSFWDHFSCISQLDGAPHDMLSLRTAYAYPMLVGACNPMTLCPIHIFRHAAGVAVLRRERRGPGLPDRGRRPVGPHVDARAIASRVWGGLLCCRPQPPLRRDMVFFDLGLILRISRAMLSFMPPHTRCRVPCPS